MRDLRNMSRDRNLPEGVRMRGAQDPAREARLGRPGRPHVPAPRRRRLPKPLLSRMLTLLKSSAARSRFRTEMPREIDYYGLLGVARDASEAEIRERFRALAREAHPDRAPAAQEGGGGGEVPGPDRSRQRADESRAAQGLRLRPGRGRAACRRTRTRSRRTTSARASPPTRSASSPRRPATSSSPSGAIRGRQGAALPGPRLGARGRRPHGGQGDRGRARDRAAQRQRS